MNNTPESRRLSDQIMTFWTLDDWMVNHCKPAYMYTVGSSKVFSPLIFNWPNVIITTQQI